MQVFKHGISVSFYGFNGMIDSIHLNDHGGGDSLDEIYRKKKKVIVRFKTSFVLQLVCYF